MKNNILIIYTVLVMLFFAGCSNIDSYQNSIYNDNMKISKQGDSFSFKDRIGTIEDNSLSLTFNAFYGKQTIWQLDSKEHSSIDLDIKVKVTNGKFKICLINNNKEVTVIAEGSKDEIISINVPTGNNYIAILGRNAAGEVNATISNKVNVSINKMYKS